MRRGVGHTNRWAGINVNPRDIRIEYRDKTELAFSVARAWKRLEHWLAEYRPEILANLNPPASEKDIRTFEKTIGRPLPDDVCESLLIHNGGGYNARLVYGLELLSIERLAGNWYGEVDTVGYRCVSFPAGMVRCVSYHSGWIPLTYDSGGNHIGVDLVPDCKGAPGQVIVFGPDDDFHTVLAHSWAQFLTDLADELERGNFRIDEHDEPCHFRIATPQVKHFHMAGITWSRRKLGLRKLSNANQQIWDSRAGEKY